MFESAAISIEREFAERQRTDGKSMRFGVEFLDDATRGIFPDDLILLGAPSGIGKTQLCCNIALANVKDGSRVHYIALEASRYEIERRLKYPIVTDLYFKDPNRPRLERNINYPDWLLGRFTKDLSAYEYEAEKIFKRDYVNLHLHYKGDRFGVAEMIIAVTGSAQQSDLIIIDHLHYFDFEDENENRAIKQIAKAVRDLAIEEQKPIVLVAHLRKRDRQNEDLVSDLDEFHGSSDLSKIATKVITFAPGRPAKDGTFETFFRIPKSRIDGSVTRYIGREFFSPKEGGYVQGKYEIGWSNQKRGREFEVIDPKIYPDWARTPTNASRDPSANFPKQSAPASEQRRPKPFTRYIHSSERD